jgi:hypothetical protein
VLTARGRRLRALVLIALAAASFSILGENIAFASPAEPTAIVVAPNDTLWDIAVAHNPEVDTRELVWQITQLNDLKGGHIEAGQELLLPN